MKRMKTRKAKSSFVCLVAAILLIPAHSVIAQINIGGVTISIPKRAKSPKRDKPETKVESSAELSSDKNEEADNKSSATSKASSAQSDAWLEIILEEINKRKKEVESYDPSARSQLVTRSTPELFFPAISLRAREAYYKSVQMNETRRSALNTALDSLATAAAKKLPLYKPEPVDFCISQSARRTNDGAEFEKWRGAKGAQNRSEGGQLVNRKERIWHSFGPLQTRIRLGARQQRRPSLLSFVHGLSSAELRRRRHIRTTL